MSGIQYPGEAVSCGSHAAVSQQGPHLIMQVSQSNTDNVQSLLVQDIMTLFVTLNKPLCKPTGTWLQSCWVPTHTILDAYDEQHVQNSRLPVRFTTMTRWKSTVLGLLRQTYIKLRQMHIKSVRMSMEPRGVQYLEVQHTILTTGLTCRCSGYDVPVGMGLSTG